MKNFTKTWQCFRTNPDVWFFYGFLVTRTLSIRKVLFFYPINGQFNEYAGIYLYLSDIFLILMLLTWVSITLYNKINLLSIISTHLRKMFHVEHFQGKSYCLIIIPLILIIWSFISLIWSENRFLALFRSLKLAEFYLLYIYVIYQIVPRGTILKNTFRIIIAVGVFQSVLGIAQFALQHSVGLVWLHESQIGTDIPGVAKLIIGGNKVIRAYGTFPHPNIFGGFLLVSLLMTYFYQRMFHVEHSDTQNPNSPNKSFVTGNTRFLLLFIAIQFLALISTFSKSAILGLIIALTYILFQANVPRGTIAWSSIRGMFHMEHLMHKTVLVIGIFLVLGIIFRPDTNSLLFKSLNERLFYLNVSRGTILANPLIGVGNGHFVSDLSKFVPRGTIIQDWQYQPVHNIFLLIWSELGIIGLGIFIRLLWKLFHVEQLVLKPDIKCSTWNNKTCEVYEPTVHKNVPRGTFLAHQQFIIFLKGLLLGLLFIGFFDHYLWDIQQGEALLWLVFGLLAGQYLVAIDNF